MTAPYRDETATLRAEVDRLRRALATRADAPTRYAWRAGDYLAAPVIVGGYPMGVLLIVACIRLALPVWAASTALAFGAVWHALALLWMRWTP